MLQRPAAQRRSGAALVEAALVFNLFFLMLLMILLGGLGIFRYFEVAHLAREGARYASVHGSEFYTENAAKVTKPASLDAWKQKIYDNAIKGKQVLLNGLSENNVTVSCTTASYSNGVPPPRFIANGTNPPTPVRVTVTVTYDWVPEVLILGSSPIRLSSTSSMIVTH